MTSNILFLMFYLTILFLFLNHPLSFGLILLLETFLISIITGLMNYNFWFSYILFLIMVGGMLILFIYMTSVASNEKFKLSFKIITISAMILTLSMLLIFNDFFFSNLFVFNYDLAQEHTENSFSMSKYTSPPTNKIMMMIIIYLLIALIMVVKITNIHYGPLRQKF